jgi:putative ABC transport system permease protein
MRRMRDFLMAIRFARRQPAFVGIAVLTLALGIGANATIFSFVNTVFFRPLPVRNPGELVSVFTTDAAYPERLLPVSYPDFVDYRESHVFVDLAAEVRLQLNIGDGSGPPERVIAASVSANYFDVLGVRPLLGRTFTASEDAPLDAHPLIVISSRLWRRRFGADPQIAGRTIAVNGQRYTVIGVADDGFRGATLLSTFDAWVPISQRHGIVGFLEPWFLARRARMCAVYARMKSPNDFQQATTGLSAVAARLAIAYPQDNRTRGTTLVPFTQAAIDPNLRAPVVRMAWFLTIVVGLVLALACTNVANLLLLRALARDREIAVRLAIGASRGRLVRQLLAESVAFATLGGLAGVLVAVWGRQLLWTFKPPLVPDTLVVPFDRNVLLYTLAVTLLTGLVCGVVPALHASRPDIVTSLKGPITSGATAARRRFSAKNLLVVGQIALSTLLLVGTGLVLRSLARAEGIDPGIAADHLIVLNMNPDAMGYDRGRAVAFFQRVIDTVNGVPGVRSAAFAFNKPLTGAIFAFFYLEGKDVPSPTEGAPIATNAADTHYFATVGLPLLEGRNFTASDAEESEASIIINKTVRDRYFARNESPVGRHMRFVDTPTPFTIVGVVADSAYSSIGEQTPNYFYYPFRQAYGAGEVTLYVRTNAAPQALVGTVRSAIQALDPNLPLYNIGVVSDVVTQSLWVPRAASALLGFFGALGLVLAAVGTYGVMAFHVDQSRREIGIRMALGEARTAILTRVLQRGMTLVGIGLFIGLAIAVTTTRFIATFLYGLSATDVVTFAVATIVLAIAALGATLLPARRATRVDPLIVLRAE